MKVEPYDIYVNKEGLVITYAVRANEYEKFGDIKSYLQFEKRELGNILDITEHKDYLIIHISHSGDESTFKEIKEQQNYFEKCFPPEDGGFTF
jgi:hypothetical protein